MISSKAIFIINNFDFTIFRAKMAQTASYYTDLTVQSLNIDGVSEEKMFILEDYVITNSPDFLLIQESKVTSDSLPTNLDMAGYTYSVKERPSTDKPGGGLISYWKSDIPARTWENPSKDKDSKVRNESQWMLIEAKTTRIAICNVYMACESGKNKSFLDWNREIYNELKKDVNTLRDMNFAILILGDLNGWVGQLPGMEGNHAKKNQNGTLIMDFVNNEELYILNQINRTDDVFTRTHYAKNGRLISQSCLDYAIISKEAKVGDWSFSIYDINESDGLQTDHKIISVTGTVNVMRSDRKKKVSRPDFTDMTKNNMFKNILKDTLKQKDQYRFRTAHNSTRQATELHNIIHTASKKAYATTKRIGGKGKRKISQVTRRLIQQKHEIKHKLKNDPTNQMIMQEYLLKKRELKDSIMNGILTHRKKVRLELALKDPNKKMFWRLLKRTPGKDQGITAAWDENKKLVFDPKKVQEIVHKSFKTRLNGKDEPTEQSKKKDKKASKLGKILSKPVSEQELKKVIAEIKKEKSPGPFGIYGEHIKYGGYWLHNYIRTWINTMLKEGLVPDFLKQGRVSLLYKRGDCLEPSNYRPICITSVMLKTLTRLMNKRLETVVESNGFLNQNQFGFRKSHSTTDAILIISAAIDKAKMDGMDAGLTSIDLRAAYDMVCRTTMFKKLRTLGINGTFLAIIEDYYTNDSVVYAVNDGTTKPLYMTQGVKQGCNLSPMLFNLFLVDVIQEIHDLKLGIKLGKIKLLRFCMNNFKCITI